jgi:hypothetical protein
MIISHKHKFIFIHGPKTAGTAIADQLQPVCGDSDIVVQKRTSGLQKHDGSERIRDFVGDAVWQSYFKFTFERNPWDKIFSLYCMQMDPDHWLRDEGGDWTRVRSDLRRRIYGHRTPSFRKWLLRKNRGLFHSPLPEYLGHLYFIEGPLAVDFIGRFEELHQDFAKITDRLGLDIRLGTSDRAVRRKTDPDFDPATPSYRKHYDEELREVVRRRYQREIEHFGYEF